MSKKVRNGFDGNGMSIPFPQVTYHGFAPSVSLPRQSEDAEAKTA